MSQAATHTPNLPSIGISMALLASELPALASDDLGPEWLKVTPRGRAQTRDGRSYAFNPEVLVARFNADKVEIPADVDHGLALRAVRGERVDSIGYAAALEARPDGTYARMNWLDGGKAVLAARTHRYVSPSFFPDEAGNAVWLHSISLVAAPALSMPALLSAQPGGRPPSTVAEALGLASGADEAACLSAIGSLRTNSVPAELLNDVLMALSVAQATLAARDTEARQEKVSRLLDGALKEMRILPCDREDYEALCATEAGFQHVVKLIAKAKPHPVSLASGLDGLAHPAGDLRPERSDEVANRAARYRESEVAAGRRISQSEAVRHVLKNPKSGQ